MAVSPQNKGKKLYFILVNWVDRYVILTGRKYMSIHVATQS